MKGVSERCAGRIGKAGGGQEAAAWLRTPALPPSHSCPALARSAGYEVILSRSWDRPGAYPTFDPPEDFAPFKLAPGLFYAAALENAASAMGA